MDLHFVQIVISKLKAQDEKSCFGVDFLFGFDYVLVFVWFGFGVFVGFLVFFLFIVEAKAEGCSAFFGR